MSDEFSDQVFDYFVEELVTQQSPPDLSARIAAAWKQEKNQRAGIAKASGEDLVVAEVVDLATARDGRATQSRGSVQLAHTGRGDRRKRWENRNLLAVILATSACGLLALISWQLPTWSTAQPVVATGDSFPGDETLDDRNSAPGPSNVAVAEKRELPAAEVLDIGGLPFADEGQSKSTILPAVSSPSIAAAAAWDESEIIKRIDDRVAEIWQVAGVSPTPPLSPTNRVQRVSLLLTGSNPLEASAEQAGELQSLVSRGVGSQAFARHWAKQFITQWLSRSSLPLESEPIGQLEKSVAAHIQSGRPWNTMASTLLGGQLDGLDDSSPTATFVTALAGNGNHRLVERLGTGFLDTNLGCVRCHDSSDSRGQPSLENQKVYWSLIALLQGLETNGKSSIGERGPVDRQPQLVSNGKLKLVYFDLLDGRLQAAEPRLPTGEEWQSMESAQLPRQALANWISESPQMDLATVNQVWKFIFGKHLVPQVAGFEDVAIPERETLQRELAEQFRLHDRDVRQLVSWIVRSDAANRQSLNLTPAEWLKASDAQLTKLQIAEMVFATGTEYSPSASRPLENVLSTLIKWQSENLGSARAATLAQPVPSSAQRSSKKNNRAMMPGETPADNNSLSMPSLSYVLHGDQPTAAEVDFVNRLLSSKRLSWTQCVSHIVALNPNRQANGRIQQLAAEILQQHSGDTSAALLDLLWAVKSST